MFTINKQKIRQKNRQQKSSAQATPTKTIPKMVNGLSIQLCMFHLPLHTRAVVYFPVCFVHLKVAQLTEQVTYKSVNFGKQNKLIYCIYSVWSNSSVFALPNVIVPAWLHHRKLNKHTQRDILCMCIYSLRTRSGGVWRQQVETLRLDWWPVKESKNWKL